MVNIWSRALLLASALTSVHAQQKIEDTIYTTGVTEGFTKGNAPVRQHCGDLSGNDLNLYICALYKLENRGFTAWNGHMRVAGIHGSSLSYNTESASNGGWCPHGSLLFLPWHRVYLSHYEQMLYKAGQDCVNEFSAPSASSTKSKYQSALSKLRLCFIDFSAGGIPDAWTQKYCKIERGAKSTGAVENKWIVNPMRKYTLVKSQYNNEYLSPGGGGSTWSTAKNPYLNSTDRFWYQDDEATAEILSNNFASLKTSVYRALTMNREFGDFSNTGTGSDDNIENYHNTLHTHLGGDGQMSYPEFAAFDPIFWNHHANIDRLWAMWQVMNPSSTIEDDEQCEPFLNKNGGYWLSRQAEKTETFGYNYQDCLTYSSKSAMQGRVDELYGSNSGLKTIGSAARSSRKMKRQEGGSDRKENEDSGKSDSKEDEKSDSKNPLENAIENAKDAISKIVAEVSGKLDEVPDAAGLASSVDKPELLANITSSGTETSDYVLSYKINLGKQQKPFTCAAFFKEFDKSDRLGWPKADAFVSSNGVFTGGSTMEMVGTYTIPLTVGLTKAVDQKACAGLDQENVSKYLTKNLRWACRANSKEDNEIDTSDFEVTVKMSKVKCPDSNTIVAEKIDQSVVILTLPNSGEPINPDLELTAASGNSTTPTNTTSADASSVSDAVAAASSSGMADLTADIAPTDNKAENATGDNTDKTGEEQAKAESNDDSKKPDSSDSSDKNSDDSTPPNRF